MKVEAEIHFGRKGHGARRVIKEAQKKETPIGRLPRVTKLMALAIRFDRLIREGQIKDYSEIARLGHVSRARVTQIMNLLLLAPEIQEQILFLPRVTKGEDPVVLRELQGIMAAINWDQQISRWQNHR
jgi:hypothetical protein